MIVEMAAARAAVKFGSEAMAALTVSTMEVWRWPICSAGVPGSLGGKYIGWPRSCGQPCKGRGNIVPDGDGGIMRWYCMGLWLCVKSRVMVGNGAEADNVAIVDA